MGESPKPKSRLSHVARLAGVSRATASRALRGEGRVAPETVERVRRAAESIGYWPDPYAKNLRTGEGHKLLAVIVDPVTQLGHSGGSDVSHQFWFRAFFQLWTEMSARDVTVVMATIDNQKLLATLPISTVLITSTVHPRPLVNREMGDVPVFVLGVPKDDDDSRIKGYIRFDDRNHTVKVLDHLWERGADNIAVAYRPYQGDHAVDTISEYRRWCDEKGQAPVIIEDLEGPEELTAKVTEALDSGCDAFFSYLPESRTVFDAIVQSGKSMPDDIMLVAHAEGVLEASRTPSVTTLSMRGQEVVLDMIDPLMRAMNNEIDDQEFVTVYAKLVQRESTDRPVIR
ncbi:MAG: LacI family DNA-binding transcriptional regulator [Candidatus Nanopelagicales bacterium]